MKALVTGGSGFVGGHLRHHLLTMGDDTTLLDPTVDIADEKALSHALDSLPGGSVETIYHLAALANVGESFGSAHEVFRVNVMGTLNLLEAARRVYPKARIIFVSSSEVYGRVSSNLLPVDEDSPVAPLSPYAASKAAAEQVAMQAFRAYGQQVIVARPFNHIGPGQSESYVVSALAKRVLLAQKDGIGSIRVGSLHSRRDFTDVRDVVRAYRRMAEVGVAGTVYNVASGQSVSISWLADRIIELAGAEVVLERDPRLVRDVEVSDIYGDSSRCRSELSWKPAISIEESLKDVLGWWSIRLEGD